MQTQTQAHNENTDNLNGGLSGKNLETAIGGELMDAFFGAAIGGALGVPTSFGALDMGTAADMVDEYHKDKAREFELGKKSSIARDFNFGGMNYSDIKNNIESDETGPSWRANKTDIFEHEYQNVPLQPNPEIAQNAFAIPAL